MENNSVAAVSTETVGVVSATPHHKAKRRRRGRGQGGLFKKPGSGNWYLAFQDLNKKQHTESSGTTDKQVAQAMLTSKLETVRRGEMVDVRKLRYEDIRAVVMADYKAKGKLVEKESSRVARLLRLTARGYSTRWTSSSWRCLSTPSQQMSSKSLLENARRKALADLLAIETSRSFGACLCWLNGKANCKTSLTSRWTRNPRREKAL